MFELIRGLLGFLIGLKVSFLRNKNLHLRYSDLGLKMLGPELLRRFKPHTDDYDAGVGPQHHKKKKMTLAAKDSAPLL